MGSVAWFGVGFGQCPGWGGGVGLHGFIRLARLTWMADNWCRPGGVAVLTVNRGAAMFGIAYLPSVHCKFGDGSLWFLVSLMPLCVHGQMV